LREALLGEDQRNNNVHGPASIPLGRVLPESERGYKPPPAPVPQAGRQEAAHAQTAAAPLASLMRMMPAPARSPTVVLPEVDERLTKDKNSEIAFV